MVLNCSAPSLKHRRDIVKHLVDHLIAFRTIVDQVPVARVKHDRRTGDRMAKMMNLRSETVSCEVMLPM